MYKGGETMSPALHLTRTESSGMSKTLQDEKQATPEVNALEVDGDETVGPSGISPEDDARIRRKIDFNLLPLLCIIYGLQFVSSTSMQFCQHMDESR